MVDSGTMQLHDSVRPALTAGTYRFDITTNPGGGISTVFNSVRWLTIESPRFRIEEHDLLSVYPMAGTRGDFSDQLPWVALRRRTLPWERRGSVEDPASPWLALVLTLRNEANLGAAPLASVVGTTAAAKFGSVPTDPVPALQFANSATLSSILPKEPDARLLSHVREVNQADSELAGFDDDGWVAVVVANRLVTGTTETLWRATLVSLEHRDDLASGQPETSSLLALASWEFTSAGGLGSFQKLIRSLDRAAFGAVAEDPAASRGVALTRTDHAGKAAKVRYRSPMMPDTGSATGDETDITPVAAHELGRLLAATDGRLLRELVEWRRMDATAASRSVTSEIIARSAAHAPSLMTAGEHWPVHLAAAVNALHHVSGVRLPTARPTGHPSARPDGEPQP